MSLTLVCSSKRSKVTQSCVNHMFDTRRTCVTCLGPRPIHSWQNATKFWPLTRHTPLYSYRRRIRNGHVSTCFRHMSDMCHVSGTMSTKFLAKFYPISSPHSPLVQLEAELVRQVSHVLDHVYWIPGEILPHFDPSHSHVAHLEAKLIMDKCQHVSDTCHVSGTMSIEFLVKLALLKLELKNYQIFRTEERLRDFN